MSFPLIESKIMVKHCKLCLLYTVLLSKSNGWISLKEKSSNIMQKIAQCTKE